MADSYIAKMKQAILKELRGAYHKIEIVEVANILILQLSSNPNLGRGKGWRG